MALGRWREGRGSGALARGRGVWPATDHGCPQGASGPRLLWVASSFSTSGHSVLAAFTQEEWGRGPGRGCCLESHGVTASPLCVTWGTRLHLSVPLLSHR